MVQLQLQYLYIIRVTTQTQVFKIHVVRIQKINLPHRLEDALELERQIDMPTRIRPA